MHRAEPQEGDRGFRDERWQGDLRSAGSGIPTRPIAHHAGGRAEGQGIDVDHGSTLRRRLTLQEDLSLTRHARVRGRSGRPRLGRGRRLLLDAPLRRHHRGVPNRSEDVMSDRSITIDTGGMHCASCAILVDDCMEELDGVVSSQTDLKSGRCVTVLTTRSATPTSWRP